MTERSCNAEALLTEVIRLVLDQVPLLIQVVRPDGSLFYVNQLWRSTLGYTETQVPTLSIFALVDAGELTHLKEVVAKVLAGESIDRAQTRFRTAQGSLVHLEGSWMRSISSGGDPVACTFFQAVSANKGEQVSRERLLAIVDETPDFICTADAKGRVLYANAALRRLLPSLTDDQKNHPPRRLSFSRYAAAAGGERKRSDDVGNVERGERINRSS